MLNFTDFLWSYKISVSVQIYRDCNLQRKCGHLTKILPTFLKSVNGSSFPVNSQDDRQTWQTKHNEKQKQMKYIG